MCRTLIIILGLIYTSLSFAQKDSIISGDDPDQTQDAHQYIVREAYKLLKAQIGYNIPILQNHIGYNQTGEIAFVPGNLVVIGAYREDEEDPVYGITGPFSWYVSNTHFWDPDGGDGSHFCMTPTNECFENAYVKASAYFYSGPIIYNYAQPTNNPYWFACGSPSLITGLVFDYDNIFDFYLTGSARVLAVRNLAGYLDWCSEPVEVQWVQSFREKVSWEILGRVAHLLADVSTPTHAHNDQHDPVFGGPDTYEDTMGEDYYYANWDYLDGLAQNTLYGGAINVLNKPNPLKYLFYTSAQIAGHFPSDDVAGNNNQGLNEPFANYPPLQTIINLLGPPPSSVNVNQIASTSFVYSIRATAALLHWFSNEVGIIPPPPPPLSVTITGPSSAQRYTTSTFPSDVTGAQGNVTYQWEQMFQCCGDGPDCGTYYLRGSNSTLNIYNASQYHYYLRLTVWDGLGRSAVDYHYVTVETCVQGGGGGCPTLAFESDSLSDSGTEDENPLLITSTSYPTEDVVDYYLIQSEIAPVNGEIHFTIHEPQTEHTWFDQVEMIKVESNQDEFVAVTDNGEVVNYLEPSGPITIMLYDSIDVSEALNARDENTLNVMPGDVLSIEITGGGGDINNINLFIILEGYVEAKNITADIMFIPEGGGDEDLGDVYLRPNVSVASLNLGSMGEGILQIEFHQAGTMDYLTLVNDLNTADIETLEMISAVHNEEGNVLELLIGDPDQQYAEIFPGQEIAFAFSEGTHSLPKIEYILKTVGRYETDTTDSYQMLAKTTEEVIIPKENKLYDNYPNPFNPTTQIKYSVKEDGLVTLKVYDVLGKEVAVLVNEEKDAGIYTITFDGGNISSGIYFYTISAKEFKQTKKMILVK